MHGKIAMTYFEWAGVAPPADHRAVAADRRAGIGRRFAADIGRARYTRASRTSISGALLFGAPLFDGSGYRGIRRVIDVSGDGVNNNGPLVTVTRDEVLAKGITINGLPIMLKRPNSSTMDIDQLDVYFEDCVIGGPGAFVIPIRSAISSRRRSAPSWCWRSPAVSRSRASCRSRRARRASPAPSASGCGRSAGATDATGAGRSFASAQARCSLARLHADVIPAALQGKLGLVPIHDDPGGTVFRHDLEHALDGDDRDRGALSFGRVLPG